MVFKELDHVLFSLKTQLWGQIWRGKYILSALISYLIPYFSFYKPVVLSWPLHTHKRQRFIAPLRTAQRLQRNTTLAISHTLSAGVMWSPLSTPFEEHFI